MTAFISSEFGYCSLVWLFHRMKLNSRVKKPHYRAIRIFYEDYASLFTEFLEKNNVITILNRNILLLATELFKVSNGLSLFLIKEIFVKNVHYYQLKKT